MKKILIVFLCVVSVGLLFFMASLEGRFFLGVELLPEKKLSAILENKAETDRCPETLTLDQHTVFCDAVTGTIFLAQSLDSEEPRGILKAREGILYLEQNDSISNLSSAMAENTKFTLYQVFEQSYCKYDVAFTGLPMMRLSVQDSYQREINFTDKTVYQSVVEVVDPYRQETAYQKTKCEFYRRGLGSYEKDYVKENYRLTLTDDKKSFLGMRKDDDWLLNGLLDDSGLVHNKVCYTLWNRLAERIGDSKTFSTNMEYVDLFIGNEYMGTYGLMERIDRKQLQLSEQDKLYKVRSPRVMEEYDFTNEMIDGVRPIAECKFPNDPKEEDWLPLKQWNDCFRHGWIDHMEDAYDLIDYQNAIDYNLFNLLVCGVDNTMNNSYLVADYQETTDSYQIKRIPWDLNLTFGSEITDTPETNWVTWSEKWISDVSTWTPEMIFLYCRDEKKVALDMYTRWIELRQDLFTRENIYSILDEQFAYLYTTGAYRHNYEWYSYDESSWNDRWIYDFVDKRIAFLDLYFERLYRASVGEAIYVYNGVDYTKEFNPWYYWNANYDVLCAPFEDHFDENALLEHYALYGKPYGLIGKRYE